LTNQPCSNVGATTRGRADDDAHWPRRTPTRSATRPGARQRSRPDAEIDGAESSWHCLSASSHADNATRRSRKKQRGRDKYHSYQEEVCRWSREIDAPPAAPVAWRVIRARRARGCRAPAGRAGVHGGLPRGLVIARRPGPGQAAGVRTARFGPCYSASTGHPAQEGQ
jgi:hypothetical protein